MKYLIYLDYYNYNYKKIKDYKAKNKYGNRYLLLDGYDALFYVDKNLYSFHVSNRYPEYLEKNVDTKKEFEDIINSIEKHDKKLDIYKYNIHLSR